MRILNKQARVLWILSQRVKEKKEYWKHFKDKPLYEVMRKIKLIEGC